MYVAPAFGRRDSRVADILPQLSTDKTGDDSLVGTTANVYGGLDQTQNHINYPDSKWDNIKNNMGQGSGGGSSTPPPAPHVDQHPHVN